ncbi:serine--tRNA synthetase-like protein Slimp [Battus philenor]|uniref:serine--tRNA synthetase-like protein Slimp n=1 Tax=Battus philenor TaxID=42288 RepID=UPI0035CEF7E6
MICKAVMSNLLRLRNFYILPNRYSALFINGPKATDTFVYVTPHIDFPESIKNEQDIELNLLNRKSNVNLVKIKNLWLMYEELKNKKLDLEKRRAKLNKELENLIKNAPADKEIEKLKIQSSLLKENIKKLKVPFWSAEEAAIVESLKLPNLLHSWTPLQNYKIIYTYKTQPNNNKKNHLEIGRNKNLLQFTNKENYYFKGDAALFELGAKFYFSKVLKDNDYIQFSNPDFVKSLVIEGCGQDHTNPSHSFILHHNEDSKVNLDNRLHLTGGGSLFSFFAYYTKNVLYSRVFPLKYFSMGRQYSPAKKEEIGLFNVSQSSVVSMFIATREAEECNAVLAEILEIVKKLYSKLGYPFQLTVVPADRLQMWESLKIIIQMYSTSMKSYVEIANISVSGDFISKRLMFTYTEDKQSKFPHVISGTILNVPKLLGCVLEQDSEFHLPSEFMVNNWGV